MQRQGLGLQELVRIMAELSASYFLDDAIFCNCHHGKILMMGE
jgi:hypothetical protein